jgi:hypothetical protein
LACRGNIGRLASLTLMLRPAAIDPQFRSSVSVLNFGA